MTVAELRQRLSIDELAGWAAYDEMTSIIRDVRNADRAIPNSELLRMVIEDQVAHDWHGRVS